MSTNANQDDAGEQPSRPLRQRDIIRMLLERGSSEHSSVTLTRNARGETQIEVVVRTGDAGGTETVEQAEQHAREAYDRLRELYPYGADAAGGAS